MTLARYGIQKNREERILSHQEHLQCKEKSLCFKFGDLYNLLHKRANKMMRVSFMIDDEEGEALGLQETEELQQAKNSEVEATSIILYWRYFAAPNNEINGEIEGMDVLLLIDSRASHNLASLEFVEKLVIEVYDKVKFWIVLEHGCKIAGQGVCSSLSVDLGVCVMTCTN